MPLFAFIVGVVIAIILLPVGVGALRHEVSDPCDFFKTEASLSGPNVLSAVLRNQPELEYLTKALGAQSHVERLISHGLYKIAENTGKSEGTFFCYQMNFINIIYPDQFDEFFEEAARSIVNTN